MALVTVEVACNRSGTEVSHFNVTMPEENIGAFERSLKGWQWISDQYPYSMLTT